MQNFHYRIITLLVCRTTFIYKTGCSRAANTLSTSTVAHMRMRGYWLGVLLICILNFIDSKLCFMCTVLIIEVNNCLRAFPALLKFEIAYVHLTTYWNGKLLMCIQIFIGFLNFFMCKSTIIETANCLCACWHLLNRSFACMRNRSCWI